MHHQRNRIIQEVFIAVTVPLLSMCATFIVLYTIMPRFQAPLSASIEVPVAATESIIKPVVHDAVPAIQIAAPVQLKIGKIAVDTVIAPVGVTTEGNMDIDENPKQAAWYKFGPKPGEEGSAVIAGHYGWKNGIPSVFNDLHTLVAGDQISTVGKDGKAMAFVVTRLATYAPDQNAADVFLSDDGKSHLNLITCQGSWNNSVRTYSERLVVFSDLVVQ